MKKMFSHYKKVSEWIILENMTVHFFDDNETPFDVVKVCIGELEVHKVELNNHYEKNTYPIIRWMTKGEYNYMKDHEDMLIW